MEINDFLENDFLDSRRIERENSLTDKNKNNQVKKVIRKMYF